MGTAIEYRWAQGRNDRLPTMAAELGRRPVRLKAAGDTETDIGTRHKRCVAAGVAEFKIFDQLVADYSKVFAPGATVRCYGSSAIRARITATAV